jgi:hypothetical protein
MSKPIVSMESPETRSGSQRTPRIVMVSEGTFMKETSRLIPTETFLIPTLAKTSTGPSVMYKYPAVRGDSEGRKLLNNQMDWDLKGVKAR